MASNFICPECGSDEVALDESNTTEDLVAYECDNCGAQFDEDEAGKE